MDANEIKTLISKLKYLDWTFEVSVEGSRLRLNIPTSEKVWHSRSWMLSPHMTASEIVQTAFLAVQVAEEHEIRERFQYKGETIFGPHYNVDALVSLCHQGGQQARPDNRETVIGEPYRG